jgi:succinyl-diaminopimelate desuccinylase
LTVVGNAPSAPVPAGNELLERLRRAGDLQMEPKQAWTPVAEFAAHGLDAINFGPGDPQMAHRRDERIAVDAMGTSLEVLRGFLCS